MQEPAKPHNCGCGCTETYKLLAELLDGDCCENSRRQLRARIAECPECLAQLGIEEEVRSLLRRCCSNPAPATLYERISVSIRVQRGGR